jgi:hypothetical protein
MLPHTEYFQRISNMDIFLRLGYERQSWGAITDDQVGQKCKTPVVHLSAWPEIHVPACVGPCDSRP